MPQLAVIVASTRPGRAGPAIADWFLARAKDHGELDAGLVDLAEVNLPFLDEPEHPSRGHYLHPHTRRWSAIVASTDAFALVLPEYNGGLPAPLKNALDFLYEEWAHKPVGLVSYGMGSAGKHAAGMAEQVVTALRMRPAPTRVAVPLRECFGGEAVHPNEAMESAAHGMLDELTSMTGATREEGSGVR
ncbi:NADPH-dependent oxidoreductase [Actinobacteria bacterium YIM 96077]|uniref:NADPH-dependent FMN reductase n=1 Tax=Phytoactinopolyspora halophila TaxID=1981511 RepID=A0A329QZ88_9ACTN|nr:NAD(P)H-dependent oxidoreductase [Phytoactinopolyspora halophila]AYY13224.1 NADPH-dependent oxidoreductase [Actinobacteria bacterium YIM 96077]RAW17537.1 NADPH-dependent FMN reductase [Phytoactinopolyspora halophila]